MAACGLRDVYVKTGSQRAQDDGSGGHGAAQAGNRGPELKKNMTVAVMSALFRITPLVMQQRLLSHVAKKKIFGRCMPCTTKQNEELWGYYWSMSACSMEVLVGPRSATGNSVNRHDFIASPLRGPAQGHYRDHPAADARTARATVSCACWRRIPVLTMKQVSCTLHVDLDPADYRRACEAAVARHGVLRTGFLWDGPSKPVQAVFYQVALPWVEQDWRTLEYGEQKRRLAEYLGAERRTVSHLSDARAADVACSGPAKSATSSSGATTIFCWTVGRSVFCSGKSSSSTSLTATTGRRP